jgi:hypothetical protein
MAFGAIILLFPVVLSLHNVEEYLQHGEFAGTYHSRLPERLRTRRVFGSTAILLTIAVAALCLLTYRYEGARLRWICEISMFALLWNALGHCALSAIRRSLVPGARSACALVLPYSAVAVFVMHTSLGLSFRALLGCALLGAVTMPLAALVFLPFGYGLSCVRAR